MNFNESGKFVQYCKNTRIKINGKNNLACLQPRVCRRCGDAARRVSIRVSKAGLGEDSLSLNKVIALAGFEVLELLSAAVRPLNHDAIRPIVFAEAEGEWQ